MKENTVLLSVADYNELRDFKIEMKKGRVFCENTDPYYHGSFYYTSMDNALEKINALHKKEIEYLESKIEDGCVSSDKEVQLKT